ncbi:uncharacterized protein LOC127586662 isoform X1 [Pristis pectinata]|uniref:uncharacterized protein LOC127586662 isoform X1 n=1 Tax=Pristis pectinata TaxID=685728 RepID=UPI00223DB4A6|nr:uncharacterized protein LOC127586662 isoform X1 [Pristis pectinata]
MNCELHMNHIKLFRELTYRERTMKDFEELRKLCCTDNPDEIEMTATSNGIEKGIKRGGNFMSPTGKDVLKLKKKKEVLCGNSSTMIKGQNGESMEDVCLDVERKGQKNFAQEKKKSVLEQKQVKTRFDEGCVDKPGKINNANTEEKAKHKTKCVGRTAKTNKETPSLSDSQYEKLFQSVIDKTLEECIASSKKHELQSFQEESELLLASENTEPSINNGSEDLEMQGIRKIKTKAKDKKVNRLSRKNKMIANINEASEANKEGRKHKRKGQPKKIVPDYTRFIDDDEETALEFSSRPSPSFVATSRSDTSRGSGSMEPSRGDNSHDMPAGNSDPWATPAAMREYLPKEEEESVQDSPAQNASRSLSRGTREVGQYRNSVFGCHQLEGEVGDVLASKFLELQQEGFHILHRDLMQLQETLGEGINSFSRKLAKRLVRMSNQMSVLVELLRSINTALVPGPSVQISVACQTNSKEVQDPSGTMSTHTTTEQVGPEPISSMLPSPPFLSATLRKRRSSTTTRSEDKPSKVVRVGV